MHMSGCCLCLLKCVVKMLVRFCLGRLPCSEEKKLVRISLGNKTKEAAAAAEAAKLMGVRSWVTLLGKKSCFNHWLPLQHHFLVFLFPLHRSSIDVHVRPVSRHRNTDV
ncbi:Uncharacterized protein APZ42_019671 [Daphnia magna]|uniref:Secreted protein n=1 Tax=Daphnia magna TaxID=35525 RepID=A0A164YC90_9CRUS|nr:Uncharacterized protein APZ42_019671 [Daphnia magna]